jgi:phage-related protein
VIFSGAFMALVQGGGISGFFQALAGIIAPMSPHFAALAQSIAFSVDPMAKLVGLINTAIPGFSTFATVMQGLGSVLGTAFSVLLSGNIGGAFTALNAGLSMMGMGLMTANPLLSTLFSTLGTVGAFIQTNFVPILQVIGSVLLSSFLPLPTVINGVIGLFTNMGAIIGTASGAFTAFAAAETPAAGAMAVFTALGGPVIAMFAGIAIGAAALYTAWVNNFGGIQQATAGALAAVQGLVSTVLAQIVGFWTTYGGQIVATATATWMSVSQTVGEFASALLGIVTPVLMIIANVIADHGAEIQALFAQTWQTIGVVIQAAMALIRGTIIPLLQGVGAFIAAHSSEIQAVLGGAWTIISTIISATLSVISGVITATMQAVQGNWTGAWATIQSTVATVGKALLTILQASLSGIGPLFKLALDAALAVVVGFVGSFSKAGGDIVRGIANGIKSAAGAVISAITGIMGSAIQAGKDAILSKSPSKVSADEIGVPFVQGIVVGIEKSADLLKKAARTLSKQLTEEMKKVATDAAEAFTKALQAGLDASVGFKNTALDNLKHLQDLKGDTSGLKTEQDKLKQLQQELADLQAGKAPGGGTSSGSDPVKVARELEDYTRNRGEEEAKINGIISERDQKIADIQNSSNFDQDYYDAQGKLVKGKISQIEDLNKDYADKLTTAQTRIDDIDRTHTRFLEDQANAGTGTGGSGGTDNSAAIAAKQAEIAAQQGTITAEQGREATRKQIADNAAYQISVEKAKADQISKIDAKTGAAYFALRSQQILDLADLQAQQADARAKGDNEATDDIAAQLELTQELQAAQTAQFAAQAKADSPYAQMITDLTDLQNKLQAEKEHDAYFRDMNDKNSNSLDERRRYEKINNEVLQDQAALDSVTAQLAMLGKASIDGIVSGVQGQQTVLDSAVVGALNAAQAQAEQALGIHSPSKVWAQAIGAPSAQGIGVGFADAMKSVQQNMAATITPSLMGSTVSPNASASQIANSYSNSYAPVLNIDARGAQSGVGSEIAYHINQVLDRRTASAATRRRMAT